jgi:hypothetical protein
VYFTEAVYPVLVPNTIKRCVYDHIASWVYLAARPKNAKNALWYVMSSTRNALWLLSLVASSKDVVHVHLCNLCTSKARRTSLVVAVRTPLLENVRSFSPLLRASFCSDSESPRSAGGSEDGEVQKGGS